MGKRPTNATKGGKFMNPTDQARKEARRRELKKNKKQRILVRNAVLKGKRPQEIIEELEKIDDMEYNPVTPCPLNQKVMAEKRRKLMETWDRVFKMYEKEAPDQFEEVQKQWAAYGARKIEVVRYYESVMAAKDVNVDDICLPNMSTGEVGEWGEDDSIPLPPSAVQEQPKSNLKKPVTVLEGMKSKICPGVPPGLPPSTAEYEDFSEPKKESRKRKIRFGGDEDDVRPPGLQDDEEFGDEREEEEEAEEKRGGGRSAAPAPNSLQRKMLEMAGQDLDQFMKEMEEVHKQKEEEKEKDLQRRLARLEDEPPAPGTGPDEFGRDRRLRDEYGGRGHRAMPVRPGVAPVGVGPPPGPPPGHLPPQPIRPGVPPAGVRMPPGPPPGVPPSARAPMMMPKPLGVLSAKPQINKSEVKTDKVIASAPVMRNLKSDVTRFVPTNLRVKRDDKKGKKKETEQAMFTQQKVAAPQSTIDDDYKQFMAEMKDVL